MSILQSTHLILHEEENLIKYAKKASAQNRAKALKIMQFLGLVANQGGLFHLPENTVLKKVLQKRLFKKCQVPKPLILLRFKSHLNQRELLPLLSAKQTLTAFV